MGSVVAAGLDVFREGHWRKIRGARLGLLCNQASLDSGLHPAWEIISRLLPGRLKALFGPQHGYGGKEQDNMVETGHDRDGNLDIPVFSLYCERREPSPEMLDLIDVLIIDLQDVGTRVYTYASTMLHCLRAAKRSGKRVLILDRPNPLGGEAVEGNLLRPELASFVGPYRLPMRHGLTMAEMARLFDQAFRLGCDMDIVPMKGWRRWMLWRDTALRWLMPSPNMPVPETAMVYPGQVIWEGTNVSEGRGTCRPFEIFGAPFLDTRAIKGTLISEAHRGCVLQEISFRPTFNKWQGLPCRGFMLHVTDPGAYSPLFTSLALLKAIRDTHARDFAWQDPPYEYEFEKMPIDLILGDSSLREKIEGNGDLLRIREDWREELTDYLDRRSPFLLYT
ncbi:MAG: DUF1343 domain-containing protein [Deltaproteobacteria bacterium]|nr:DUF1343 domain-containing protein [Deltaproteobacteria bacterium]